ncbi:hypothetical protein FBU30_007546 [Linnemannia zychae]|nr:hypothetical protein FBU30_007546 [Linnemannia zychae]
MPSFHSKKFAITNVDSWLSYCIALHIAENFERKCPNIQLVVLTCKDATSDLDKLKKFKNVHIHKVNYSDEKSLEKVFSGVDCSILLPEMTEHRVKHSKNILCAMKKVKVKGCLMLSVEGTDEHLDHGFHEIKTFVEIEKMVEESVSCYSVLRRSILNQCFLLWSSIVREKGEFPMPCTAECPMVPVDACDIICAIETIMMDSCSHSESNYYDIEESDDQWTFGSIHKNKKFTLTGPFKITPKELVQILNDETGQNTQLKQVTREELKKYFESLKDHEECSENLDVSSCHKMMDIPINEADDIHGDSHHRHMVPNESTLNLLLDELELVKKGKADLVTGDLEKIIKRDSKSVKDFLRKYKDDFRQD